MTDSRRLLVPLALPLALALSSGPLHAQGPSPEPGEEPIWNLTGELGLAMSRGNRRSENLNSKLLFSQEDVRSKHQLTLSALRAKSEVTGDFDGDGVTETRYTTSANRYQIGGTTAIKVNERHNWFGAARYERDDFSLYDYQGTFSFGYGHHFLKDERTTLLTEIGPGYRRARRAESGDIRSDFIVRGLLDFQRRLTDNTQLSNTLLVESGNDNTFAQNDLGVSVSMNESLALKAALQARHNTEVDDEAGIKNTDTLTTINLVYTFR